MRTETKPHHALETVLTVVVGIMLVAFFSYAIVSGWAFGKGAAKNKQNLESFDAASEQVLADGVKADMNGLYLQTKGANG